MKDTYGVERAKLDITGWAVPTLKTILTWPDPLLSEKCVDVTEFDGQLNTLIYDMAYTMVQNNGLGLAAPQIGEMMNIIIINKEFDGGYFPIVLINPKIEEFSVKELHAMREGCLSVPGHFEDRERPLGIIVSYKDTEGRRGIEEFRGQNAFVIQHEIDHLHGKVFVDHLSKLKLTRIIKKIIKTKLGR